MEVAAMSHRLSLGDWAGPSPFASEPPAAPPNHIEPPVVLVQPRWEHKHLVRLPAEEPAAEEAELNRLGAAGWELVNALFDGRMVHLYLKREAR
jgi:hypothetical protein